MKSTKISGSLISTYNGSETKKYRWSQNVADVTVQVDLDEPMKGKDVI
jgi:hypothetical protein